jgi:hypothetical protein
VNPAAGTIEQRKRILAAAIQTQVCPGMRIESQSDSQAVLVFGRAPNHILHFLIGLFTLGAWWLVWLILALSNRERRRLLTVDESGSIGHRDY